MGNSATRVIFVAASGDVPRRAAIWAAQQNWQLQLLTPEELMRLDAPGAGARLAIVCDANLDDAQLTDIAAHLRARASPLPLLLATTCGGEQRAVLAMRAGYSDYVHAEASGAEWAACLQKYLAVAIKPLLPTAPPAPADARAMIAESATMRAISAVLERVAASDCTALIIGETGTGKERVAEQIHQLSARRAAPLLPINCAALPDTLLESELFGYEKGAFTGAVNAYPGKLKLAEGGTLFLDEIGDMSLAGQAKLLRALESREFYRLGARSGTRFDVRVVAATNQPLEQLVERGLFRKDLYFRLNVARIDLPPLRERREDITPLLLHYLDEFSRRFERRAEFDPGLLQALLGYEWPGNIRELKNVVEALLVCAAGPCLMLADLPASLRERLGTLPAVRSERELLLATLARLNWNKSRAAESLCWSRMTLYRKLAKYAIRTPDEAPAAGPLVAPALYRGDNTVTPVETASQTPRATAAGRAAAALDCAPEA